MGSRPAGATSDEDSDDGYWGETPRSRSYIQPVKPVELSPDEVLLDACVNGDIDVARKAVSNRADIHNRTRFYGNHTPIMLAANRGHLEVLKFLLDEGANVNDSFEMFTVLMCLCSSPCRDEEKLLRCLDILLEHGADPHSKDWVGATPLHSAARGNHPLLVKRLLTKSSIESEDGDGWTPIFYAVNMKNIVTVKLLVQAGANIGAIDRRGNSLLDIAAQAGAADNEELTELLTSSDDTANDQLVEVNNTPHASAFKTAMLTAPRIDNRMYGFHNEAVEIIHGLGLDSIAPIMRQKNIQLAELMTWNETDWRNAGVEMSYHLKKIQYMVIKYHEQEWGKAAIPATSKIIVGEELDLFEIVRSLLDCLRVSHILSMSTLLLTKNLSPTDTIAAEMLKEIDEITAWANVAKKQLVVLKSVSQKIDENGYRPPDLIVKDELSYKKRRKFKCIAVGCVIVVVFYKYRFAPFNFFKS